MSCRIVSAMKQVTQGSIIPQRMTINSILIHIMEIVDHDVTASYAHGEMHSDGILNKICKDFIFAFHSCARDTSFVPKTEKSIFLFHGFLHSRKDFPLILEISDIINIIFSSISALFKKSRKLL